MPDKMIVINNLARPGDIKRVILDKEGVRVIFFDKAAVVYQREKEYSGSNQINKVERMEND